MHFGEKSSARKMDLDVKKCFLMGLQVGCQSLKYFEPRVVKENYFSTQNSSDNCVGVPHQAILQSSADTNWVPKI